MNTTFTSFIQRKISVMAAYQAVLILCVILLAGGAALAGVGLEDVWAVVGLAVVAALAERGRVRLGENIEASISLIPTVFAAAMFGPLAAMFVAIASFAGEFPLFLPNNREGAVLTRGAPYLRWGIYTCLRALSGGFAGLAALGATAHFGTGTTGVAMATLVASVVAEGLDVAFAATTMRLRGGRAREVVSALGPVALASIPLYTPIVALLGIAYREFSPWTLALFFVPALAAQRLFGLYQSQRELAEGLGAVNVKLSRANLSFATALVATLDARDRYTAGHSAAVAIYARDIASRMGLAPEQIELAHLCGLVHDIGKIGLPAGLLEKPGALTLDERREMQRHSEIGQESWRMSTPTQRSQPLCAITMSGSTGRDILMDSRTRNPAAVSYYRCRRCVQRDDVGSALSRRHAKPRSSSAARAGSGNTIRHSRRRGVRGAPGWRG